MVLQRTDNERIILGIDPGTNIMGYGVIKVISNKAEMVAMGIIDMRKMTDPYLRLGNIFQRVKGIIEEYLPQGQASKEQVADMLLRLLKLDKDNLPKFMDATDALGVAYCHYLQTGRPVNNVSYKGWKDFINKNKERINSK